MALTKVLIPGLRLHHLRPPPRGGRGVRDAVPGVGRPDGGGEAEPAQRRRGQNAPSNIMPTALEWPIDCEVLEASGLRIPLPKNNHPRKIAWGSALSSLSSLELFFFKNSCMKILPCTIDRIHRAPMGEHRLKCQGMPGDFNLWDRETTLACQ